MHQTLQVTQKKKNNCDEIMVNYILSKVSSSGSRLLNSIKDTKDLSTMLSVLEENEHILSQTMVLAAIKKMSEIYQRDYNLGSKFDEEEYSRAFQSLSSIIGNEFSHQILKKIKLRLKI